MLHDFITKLWETTYKIYSSKIMLETIQCITENFSRTRLLLLHLKLLKADVF